MTAPNLPATVMGAPTTPREWLQAMYGANAPGYVMTFEKSTKQTVACLATALDVAATSAVAIAAAGGEPYYGLGLQAGMPQGRGRGRSDTVCALGALWFDFDIAGEGHAQAKLPQSEDEVRAFLAELGLPPPTAIIHSGGGFHVYWFFDKLWLFETPEERKKAQALSTGWQNAILKKGRERGWKLDCTSDLARVLRLPGTYNRKTETPRLVQVIEWTGKRYSISELESACRADTKPVRARTTNESKEVNGRGDASRLLQCSWVKRCRDDAAILPEPHWYALMTLQSCCDDGEEVAQEWSKGHPGYSVNATAAKFRHAQDAPGPMTCDYIRDKLNGESHCATCKYGDRIQSPMLLTVPLYALAAEYAFCVSTLEFIHHKTLSRLSKEQFSDFHATTPVKKGNLALNVLRMPNLIRASRYDYSPGRPTILIDGEDIKINLWVNDGAVPRVGDATPFLNHIAYLVPDEAARRHLLSWIAFTVQHPNKRVKHAAILSGRQGTGKSYVARVLKLLHGPSNVHEVSVEELHSQFTAWLEGKQIIIIEELMAQGRLELANKLKPILTQEVIRINEKHRRVYQIANLASFFCTTNHDDPIYLEEGDRRWWFYRSPAEPLAPGYYAQLEEWTAQNAGIIKSYLLAYDLSEFNSNAAPPITQDKQKLIRASLPPVQWLLSERHDDEQYPFDRELVRLDQLFEFVRATIQNATPQQVVRALQKLGARKLSRTRIYGQQSTVYALRRTELWLQSSPEQIRDQLQKDGLRPFIEPFAPAQTSL